MSWERCVLLLCLAFLVCTSCSADGAPSGNDNTTIGATSTAGQPGSDGGEAGVGAQGLAGAAGAACQGDAKRWAEITGAPPPCKTAEDCCVVVNSCLAEAQVVGAKDFDAARTAWPYCDGDCNDCIAPAVVVSCKNGKCVGNTDVESGEGVSHCGDANAAGGAPGQSFRCQ